MSRTEFNPRDPVSFFREHVERDFQREFLRAIYSQYGSAFERCHEDFAQETLRDVLPHYRRGRIEEVLCELAERHDGCFVTTKPNYRRNCSHNVLHVGEHILLTQSKVDARDALPREAMFRGSYAESQQYLLDFMENPQRYVSQGDHPILYGIIAHSPSCKEHLPAFVDIIFPDACYETIVDRVKLMNEFPDVVEHFDPSEEVIRSEVDGVVRLKDASVTG